MKKAIIIITIAAIIAGMVGGINYFRVQREQFIAENFAEEEAEAAISERLQEMQEKVAACKKVVLINPYHRGEDAQAAEILVNIGLYTQAINEEDGLGIFLTREDNLPLTASQVREYIDALNPDLIIDLHLDEDSDSQISGIRGWYCSDYYNYKMTNAKFGEILLRNIAEAEENQIIELTDINTLEDSDRFDCLRDVTCPAASVSCGYLTSEVEGRMLGSDEYQQTIGWGVYRAIRETLYE